MLVGRARSGPIAAAVLPLALGCAGSPPVTRDHLAAAAACLERHPIRSQDWRGRARCFAPIDSAAGAIGTRSWRRYREAWPLPAAAGPHDDPLLGFFEQRSDRAIRQIADAPPTQDRVWQLYNAGLVLRLDGRTIGYDLVQPRIERLADQLDALLISHSHPDHYDPRLAARLRARGRPVIDGPPAAARALLGRARARLAPLRIELWIGDHHANWPWPWASRDDLAMYRVIAADGTAVLLAGDNSAAARLPAGRTDLLVLHPFSGIDRTAALRRTRPGRLLLSHFLELGHRPNAPFAWRWSYGQGFELFGRWNRPRPWILAWGESVALP